MKQNIEEILKDGADVIHTYETINQRISWIREALEEKRDATGWVVTIQRCLNALQDYSRKYPDSGFVRTNIRNARSNIKQSLPDDMYQQIRKSYRAYAVEAAKKQ